MELFLVVGGICFVFVELVGCFSFQIIAILNLKDCNLFEAWSSIMIWQMPSHNTKGKTSDIFFEISKTSDILSVFFWDEKKAPKKRQESQARWPSTLATSVCWSKCFTWKLRRPWSPALRVLTCEISVGPGWSNASWSVWSLLKTAKTTKKKSWHFRISGKRYEVFSFLVQKRTPHILFHSRIRTSILPRCWFNQRFFWQSSVLCKSTIPSAFFLKWGISLSVIFALSSKYGISRTGKWKFIRIPEPKVSVQNPYDIPWYWLVNRDPYIMVYEIISRNNWVMQYTTPRNLQQEPLNGPLNLSI